MKITFKNPDYSSKRLEKSVLKIIKKTELCSMASINSNGTCHINTAFFCFSDKLDIYFVSDWRTHHCQNLINRPKMGITVFDSHQRWDSSLRGIQLFGEGFATEKDEAQKSEALYTSRFPAYGKYRRNLSQKERSQSPHRFFVFRTKSVKVFDTDEFGEENFVFARIVRGK